MAEKMGKDFFPVLVDVLAQREEFTKLSMDRQGELLVKLGEVMAEVANATGLSPVLSFSEDSTGLEGTGD